MGISAPQRSQCRAVLCNGLHLAALAPWAAYAVCPVTLSKNEISKG